jgi:5'-nucleotidase/UDP-sugar diphosphatase
MNRVKETIIKAVILLFLAFPAFAGGAGENWIPGRTYELVLLHTNDHHGAVLPRGGRGGLAERAAYVRAVRAVHPQVLLLDAGDINTGPALSNMFNAEVDIRAYNMMGYDAVVFGNHEFDGALEKLRGQMALAEFPFVSSNIKTREGEYLGVPYLVKRYHGLTVGIFGITTLRTKIIASPDASLVFYDEIESAREMTELLRTVERADIVIGVTHMGDVREGEGHVTSLDLAEAVSGIDIIVDGHAHSFFDAPKKVNGTYIVSANEWGNYIGHGRLFVRDGRLLDFVWAPVSVGSDREVSEMIAPYLARAEERLTEVIGEAGADFVFGDRLTRKQETAIGNLVCDANAWYFRTVYGQELDFAFHNGGAIRAEIAAGPITRETVLTVLPFENYLYIASLKGSDLIALFDFIAAIPRGAGGFPQFSREVRYTVDYSSGTGRLINLAINGAPVDPERTYRFATNDYLLRGGDGYTALTRSTEPFNTSLLLSYVVIEYVAAQRESIVPVTDGRLTVIGGADE